MRLGPKALVGLGLGLALTRNKGVGVPPAPSGFAYVTSNGIYVRSAGAFVIARIV